MLSLRGIDFAVSCYGWAVWSLKRPHPNHYPLITNHCSPLLPNVIFLYNLIMAAVDIAALIAVARRRNRRSWTVGVAFCLVTALGLALWLGKGEFRIYHLAACGAFVHGPLVLIGSAFLLARARRFAAAVSMTAGLMLAAVGIDAHFIEPTWLEVSYQEIVSEKISRRVRIVVLADLQTDEIGPYERKVLQETLRLEPDLILLAGDYLQTSWEDLPSLQAELNQLLHEIDFGAKSHVFAVSGNIDSGSWPRIFQGLDVTIARRTQSFDLGQLRLTCLRLYDSYNPSLTVRHEDPDRFHIVLGHVPNFALGQVEADLLVAGHTHGGQVCLPLFGPVRTHSRIPRTWAAGMTDLSGGRKLVVPRGIGMERTGAPQIRFLCRPELAVIDLLPKQEKPAD